MPIYKMNGRKDGKQKYRVRINYKDASGAPRQSDKVTYGLDEAKLLEMQLRRNLMDNPSESILTLSQLIEEFKTVRRFEIRESSMDKFVRVLNLHVVPYFGNLTFNKITIKRLNLWKVSIEALPLALKSKQMIYSTFRTLLNYAVKMGHISSHELNRVGNFKNAIYMKKEMAFYTPQEASKFLATAKEHTLQSEVENEWDYYVFFAIAIYTGLRKGEIHALRWSDLDNNYLSRSTKYNTKIKRRG